MRKIVGGIGEVIEHITERNRGRAARESWNGRGMFIYFCPGFNNIDGFLMLKTAKGSCVPWVCSQSDLLGDDWFIWDADQDEPMEAP